MSEVRTESLTMIEKSMTIADPVPGPLRKNHYTLRYSNTSSIGIIRQVFSALSAFSWGDSPQRFDKLMYVYKPFLWLSAEPSNVHQSNFDKSLPIYINRWKIFEEHRTLWEKIFMTQPFRAKEMEVLKVRCTCIRSCLILFNIWHALTAEMVIGPPTLVNFHTTVIQMLSLTVAIQWPKTNLEFTHTCEPNSSYFSVYFICGAHLLFNGFVFGFVSVFVNNLYSECYWTTEMTNQILRNAP